MVRMVVYVQSGAIQDTVADRDGVSLMIVNYDNEDVGEPKESRVFETVDVDAEYVDATARGKEEEICYAACHVCGTLTRYRPQDECRRDVMCAECWHKKYRPMPPTACS